VLQLKLCSFPIRCYFCRKGPGTSGLSRPLASARTRAPFLFVAALQTARVQRTKQTLSCACCRRLGALAGLAANPSVNRISSRSGNRRLRLTGGFEPPRPSCDGRQPTKYPQSSPLTELVRFRKGARSLAPRVSCNEGFKPLKMNCFAGGTSSYGVGRVRVEVAMAFATQRFLFTGFA
jgi:hypothetical protein